MQEAAQAPMEEQVRKYDYLSPMLDSALAEMREFAKKKQDGIVSKPKIKMLNRLLIEIKSVVASEPSVAYLDLLSEEELPQNSDAVLILGQFRAALTNFRSRHFRSTDRYGTSKRWVTQEYLAEQVNADEGSDEDEDDEDQDD